MSQSYVSFYVDDQLFGIDILFIREINRQLDLSPVAHTADFVRGLINLRGQIVTVLDLRCRLGRGLNPVDGDAHNLILKTDAELAGYHSDPDENDSPMTTCPDKVGLLVDAVGDVITLPNGERPNRPPANLSDIDTRFLSGVITLDDQLLGVLNLSRILADTE